MWIFFNFFFRKTSGFSSRDAEQPEGFFQGVKKKNKIIKKKKDFDQTSTMENRRSKVDIWGSYERGKRGITSRNGLQPSGEWILQSIPWMFNTLTPCSWAGFAYQKRISSGSLHERQLACKGRAGENRGARRFGGFPGIFGRFWGFRALQG